MDKAFDVKEFLAISHAGRSISRVQPQQVFFAQGGAADAVFYLQSGRAKLTVVSKRGKEATVALLASGDFFGEECMAGAGTVRTSTAAAVTACVVLRIEAQQMQRILHEEHTFSDFFLNISSFAAYEPRGPYRSAFQLKRTTPGPTPSADG